MRMDMPRDGLSTHGKSGGKYVDKRAEAGTDTETEAGVGIEWEDVDWDNIREEGRPWLPHPCKEWVDINQEGCSWCMAIGEGNKCNANVEGMWYEGTCIFTGPADAEKNRDSRWTCANDKLPGWTPYAYHGNMGGLAMRMDM